MPYSEHAPGPHAEPNDTAAIRAATGTVISWQTVERLISADVLTWSRRNSPNGMRRLVSADSITAHLEALERAGKLDAFRKRELQAYIKERKLSDRVGRTLLALCGDVSYDATLAALDAALHRGNAFAVAHAALLAHGVDAEKADSIYSKEDEERQRLRAELRALRAELIAQAQDLSVATAQYQNA
ncbi:MAG: hypothetical protein Rubg2KO_16760 [Rubricoccaceae bacterium]